MRQNKLSLIITLSLIPAFFLLSSCGLTSPEPAPFPATSFETNYFSFSGLEDWTLSEYPDSGGNLLAEYTDLTSGYGTSKLEIYPSTRGSVSFMNKLIENISLKHGYIKQSTVQESVGPYTFTKVLVRDGQASSDGTVFYEHYYFLGNSVGNTYRILQFVGKSRGTENDSNKTAIDAILQTFSLKSFSDPGTTISIGSGYSVYVSQESLIINDQDILLIQPIPDTSNYIEYQFKIETSGASGVSLETKYSNPVSGTNISITESVSKGQVLQAELKPTSASQSFQVIMTVLDSSDTFIASKNITINVN